MGLNLKTAQAAKYEIDLLNEFVKNMTRRSIPMPHPPVGGNPCSSLSNIELSAQHHHLTQLRKTIHLRINKRLIDALSFVVALLLLSCLHSKVSI